MKHNYVDKESLTGAHWAVGINEHGVLLQVGDIHGEQARVLLPDNHVQWLIEELQKARAEHKQKYQK